MGHSRKSAQPVQNPDAGKGGKPRKTERLEAAAGMEEEGPGGRESAGTATCRQCVSSLGPLK